jgi:hypothetical protein
MKKLVLLLLAVPAAYVLLTGYLVVRIRPVPIVRIPSARDESSPAIERLAA